ncbi:hypothetical protein K9L97_00425 [Candidatus Woesearchaeota archaeon]|nr:hypothetical protein [Candidatus Woesearchaeota archaeon]
MRGVQLFCGPKWFIGFDAIIDLFSFIVLVLISIYAFKAYNIHRKKSLLYMAWSMILISIAFLFKILTYGAFYLKDNLSWSYYALANISHGYTCSNMGFILLFMIYALVTLIGLFLLLFVYQKEKSKSMMLLVLYLITLSLFLTTSAYYVLHLTSLIITILITLQFYYKYKKNKLSTTKFLCVSFVIYALSHLFFLLAFYNPLIYFIAEIIQLLAFGGLLYTFISVLKYGKKTGKT